jgi:protein TonB
MKYLLFFTSLFIFFNSKAQTDTTIYGYIDSVTVKNVQIPPKFPGGDGNWKLYLNKYLKYPKDAKQQKIEGTVMVEFVVEKDGSLSNITIVHSVYPSLDEEAVRLIQHSMWTPAVQNGGNARYRKRQPIEFRLLN